MGRGDDDTRALIEAAISPADISEWKRLTVSNPKSEPTEDEKASLKVAKEAEKKGKNEILDRIMSQLKPGIKKDKVKKVLESSSSRPSFLDPPSGTRDFEPADMRLRNWLFGHMRDVSASFNFKEYDAPVLEHVELYERKAGEEIVGQMYNFVDKEGTRVTLRPEMTPSLARLVLSQTNLATGEVRVPLPLKWFSIPQCWRFETTQRGRKREHYQWNLDVVGESSSAADAEVLAALCDLFKRVGLTPDMVGVRINSRKILDQVLRKAGVPDDAFAKVCVVVDKLDKIGVDAVKEMLFELKLESDTVDKIISCLSSSLEDLSEEVSEVKEIFDLAEASGFVDYLQFDPSVVRGLAYYTGVVFEAFDRAGELRAIAGGGRYDRLLQLYGGDKCQIPCCGFGFGDCVIVELLKEKNLLPDFSKPKVDFFVAPFSSREQGHAAKVATSLRNFGYSVDLALAPRKAHKAFDFANRNGARRVAFVAPTEWNRGLVRVKDMMLKNPNSANELQEGIQIDVPVDQLDQIEQLIIEKARECGADIPPDLLPTPAGGDRRVASNQKKNAVVFSSDADWALLPTEKFAVVAHK